MVVLREVEETDLPFLWEMLYEAVFWWEGADRLRFEQAMALEEVQIALADWGERFGDTGVVAVIDSRPVGAAWYRYWTNDNFINGFIDETMPVVVIGVHADYRRQGIGRKLLGWLVDRAGEQGIERISLSVSKDNYAINLYEQQGFVENADTGSQFLMVREVN